MKIATQHCAEFDRLGELIAGISVGMLTHIDAHGALVSRPMAPLEMDTSGALWFFTSLESAKIEHLRAVNLAFTDTRHSTYVSLSGRGEIDVDRNRIERMWTPFAKPWFPDGPESPDLALLKFLPDTAEYWDAPHSRMVRMLAMAASVATGKPIALGEHATLGALSDVTARRASV